MLCSVAKCNILCSVHPWCDLWCNKAECSCGAFCSYLCREVHCYCSWYQAIDINTSPTLLYSLIYFSVVKQAQEYLKVAPDLQKILASSGKC